MNQKITTLLGNDPENILKNFAKQQLPIKFKPGERWQIRFHEKIKARLAGQRQGNFLHGLDMSTARAHGEKLRLMTATWLYELEQRAKLPIKQSHDNRAVLLSAAVCYSEQNSILGQTLDLYLKDISLEEFAEVLLNAERTVLFKSLPYLTERSIKELKTQPETANNILRKTSERLFGKKQLSVDRLYIEIQAFSPQVVNHTLTILKKEYERIYNQLSVHIAEKLEKADKDYTEEIKSLENQRLWYKAWELKDIENVAKVYREFIASSSKFKECHERGIQLAKQLQQKAKEQELERKRQQEEKARQETNQEADHWIIHLPQIELNEDFLTRLSNWIEISLGKKIFDVLDPHESYFIHAAGGVTNYTRLSNQLEELINSQYLDDARHQELTHAWNEALKTIWTRFDEILASLKPQALEIIKAVLKTEAKATMERTLEVQTYLNQALEGFESILKSVQDSRQSDGYSKLLTDIITLLKKLQAEWRSICNHLQAKEEEKKREQDLIELKKKYLLELIEKQTDYLRELYHLGTGLPLQDAQGSAVAEHESIGSVRVSTSLGLSLKQELRQELTLELSIKDGIFLEAGDSLEEIKQRIDMVNWVVPHEVGHLVDWALDSIAHSIVVELMSVIEDFTSSIQVDHQEEMKKQVMYILQECVIDGLGFRLVKEYGTVDPFDKAYSRISKATYGFMTMIDILLEKIEALELSETKKVGYTLILVRMLANVEFLGEQVAEQVTVNSPLSMSLQTTKRDLAACFKPLNKKILQLTPSQKKEFIELCLIGLHRAQEISLVRND